MRGTGAKFKRFNELLRAMSNLCGVVTFSVNVSAGRSWANFQAYGWGNWVAGNLFLS